MARLPISGVVIALNEADRIGRCLASMRDLCSELLVVDAGSDDDTVAVARGLGARVEHQDWLGFAAQKNHAISLATQPWLLLLDADEWLAEGTDAQVRVLFASGAVEGADVWRLRRVNWFLGRRLRGFEMAERLVRPGLRYLPLLVHERPDLTGKRIADCSAVIEHDTARSLAQHRAKNTRYAALWARQRHQDGRRCSALAPWTHAAAYLIKSYVLRAGWRDGRAGWLYHQSHALAVLEKYRLLHAMGRAG
jgi:(heptosyl)LPS beta-1,4-glucosyltransferase